MKKLVLLFAILSCASYGQLSTTAGVRTNDSRLSDTRTPVAPTASTLGGVKSGQCTTGTGKLMGYDTSGVRICETDSTGTYDPMDMSISSMVEQFWSTSVTTGNIGTHGWGFTCTGGTVAKATADYAHFAFGILSLATSTSTNGKCNTTLGNTGASSSSFGRLDQFSGWEAKFRFQLQDISSVRAFVGFYNNQTYAGAANGSYCGIRADTAVPDTNFVWTCDNNASSIVSSATSVALDTNWHELRMWSLVTGTWHMSFDGVEAGATFTDIPATVMSPTFYVETLTTATKTIFADEFRFNVTGMTGR